MNSEQKSRLDAARAQIDAVRREVTTDNPNDPNAKNAQGFKDNSKALDDAVKALDSVKVT